MMINQLMLALRISPSSFSRLPILSYLACNQLKSLRPLFTFSCSSFRNFISLGADTLTSFTFSYKQYTFESKQYPRHSWIVNPFAYSYSTRRSYRFRTVEREEGSNLQAQMTSVMQLLSVSLKSLPKQAFYSPKVFYGVFCSELSLGLCLSISYSHPNSQLYFHWAVYRSVWRQGLGICLGRILINQIMIQYS